MVEKKHVSLGAYVGTFVGLAVLATVSLLLSFAHLPKSGLVISLAIAVVKALLVLFFFMHLVEERFSSRATVLLSVMFVALLVGLTAADVATRHTFPARLDPTAAEPFYAR